MNPSLFRFFIASSTVLSTGLIPFKVVSNPLPFWADNCIDFAQVQNCESGPLARTPGGLEAYLKSNLTLKPSNIRYKYNYEEAAGTLIVKWQGKQIEIEVEPEVVRDVIDSVETTDASWVYSVSLREPTANGPRSFIDKKLRGTVIGKIFADGDDAFGDLVRGYPELPKGAPASPEEESDLLYKSNSRYRQFLNQLESPPEIVPMISLHFDPSEKGSVRMEFPPELSFSSPDGIDIEVDKSKESLAKLPYKPLAKDVRKRPMAYRNILPNLDLAAKTVAVMGYLEAACQKPGDCQALFNQTENLVKKLKAQKEKEKDLITAARDFREKAEDEQGVSTFKPGNNPQAWKAAYKSVTRLIKNRSFYWSSDSSFYYSTDEQIEKLKDLTAQQFYNYEVPQDALLQGSSAVVFSWKGDEKLAEKAFNQAITLSSDNPLARLAVLRMSRHAIGLLEKSEDIKLAKSLNTRIKTLRKQALVAAYNEFDKYLNSCLENPGSCSEADLRQWEDDALAELNEDTTTTWGLHLDVAWLHGRFNYLVGSQLKDPSDIRNRLRYVYHYTQETSGERRTKMRQFEAELEQNLVTALNPSPIIDLNSVAQGSTPKWLAGFTALSIAGIVVGTKIKHK